ncbi:MAG: type II toxin-antitoxin system VapC family toxin [Acidobacteria bacterium]|nr:type II toxin-antitoxin system VapC family toxin [Acidobacteriota bacterium]
MILPDANLLLYAYHPRAPQHEGSKNWLEAALSGSELVRLTWPTVWAFLRISTSPKVFEQPLSIAEATAAVSSWLERPTVDLLDPGERHWDILRRLVQEAQCTGPLVTDAALAALAIEHGATLYTTDRDFSRFPGLSWTNPLTERS